MNNVTLPMVLWNLLGECVVELPFFLDGGIYGDELLGVSGFFSSTPSCTNEVPSTAMYHSSNSFDRYVYGGNSFSGN